MIISYDSTESQTSRLDLNPNDSFKCSYEEQASPLRKVTSLITLGVLVAMPVTQKDN